MLSTATPQSHQPSSDPSWKFYDQPRVLWHCQHRLGSPRTSLTFQAALPPNHCSPFTPRHLKLSPKRKKHGGFQEIQFSRKDTNVNQTKEHKAMNNGRLKHTYLPGALNPGKIVISKSLSDCVIPLLPTDFQLGPAPLCSQAHSVHIGICSSLQPHRAPVQTLGLCKPWKALCPDSVYPGTNFLLSF